MNQALKQTEQEKTEMYMKFTKKELVSMLIEANRQLSIITEPLKLNNIELEKKIKHTANEVIIPIDYQL